MFTVFRHFYRFGDVKEESFISLHKIPILDFTVLLNAAMLHSRTIVRDAGFEPRTFRLCSLVGYQQATPNLFVLLHPSLCHSFLRQKIGYSNTQVFKSPKPFIYSSTLTRANLPLTVEWYSGPISPAFVYRAKNSYSVLLFLMHVNVFSKTYLCWGEWTRVWEVGAEQDLLVPGRVNPSGR